MWLGLLQYLPLVVVWNQTHNIFEVCLYFFVVELQKFPIYIYTYWGSSFHKAFYLTIVSIWFLENRAESLFLKQIMQQLP